MIKVIFNRDYHLGKWYKQGDGAELNISLAKRLINKGIVHDAPVEKPVKKEKKVANKATKKEESAPLQISKGSNSKRRRKYSSKVDRAGDSDTFQ